MRILQPVDSAAGAGPGCSTVVGVRWDRFFEDLEDQLDSEWEAERAALDTEAERLRLARLTLQERVSALVAAAADVTVDVIDGSTLRGTPAACGPDWVALDGTAAARGAVLIPFAAVASVALAQADLLLSARGSTPGRIQERMTLGFVMRDLVRRRAPVTIRSLGGRELTGTVDRAASDHLDLALHDRDAPRRRELVTGHRMVPLGSVASIRVEAAVPAL